MTPADELRQRALALETQAAALLRLADALDHGATISPAPPEWLDTWQAEHLTKRTKSTLYRWARDHGVGEKTAAGGWRFSRTRLLELALTESQRGENASTLGDNGAGTHLLAREDAY